MPRKKKSVLEEEEEEDVFGDNEDVDVEERDKFLRDVNEFMEKRGTPIPYDNLPQLGGRRLNVYKLWLQVWSRGGYEAVCENKQWTEVRDAYQVPKTCTSASYSLKMYYQKWLYSYEQVMKLGKADPTQKQTPHVLEQQKKEAASGAVVKKVAPTVKKRVFTSSSSSSSTSKSRKTEKEYQPKKKPTTNQNVLNFPQLAQGLQIANIRKHQAEVDHSVLPIESLANAFEHRMNGFYTRTDIDNDEIMKEIEYAKRIYCSLRSDDPSLVEWALYQILRLSENESFRCDHVSDLLEFCENFLLDYACEIEKQNMRDDHDVFNLKDQRYMECQHKAFICITILRNASLIPENRSPIGKSTSLMETLTFYLRYNAKDVIHLDWRLRIMDIIINVSEFIDFSFNTIFAQIVNNTLDTNEEDGLLLSATCLECMNSILKTKTNLPVIETFLMRNPTTLEKVIEFLACPSITKPSDSYFDDNDKVDEEEEDMNGENKEEFVVENQKLTKVNVTTKLSSLELLCRVSALNFLFQLCQSTTNSSLLELLANSASFIDRIVTLIVWKSNLYSRIHQYPYIIFEQVKEHDRENSERTDGNIFAKAANGEKDDSEEYDEKNDMEEMYDGFDSCFASAQDEEKTDTPKISDSLKFQKKCVAILQALGKHTDVLKKSPQFSTYNKEFMYLMLLSHPTISNSLSSVMH